MTTTTKSRHGRPCRGHPRLAFLTAIKTWMASQLGLARVARYEVQEVGYTRLPVTSPAMTLREWRSLQWAARVRGVVAALALGASAAQAQRPEALYCGKSIQR